jgi:uncharacterized membrane protein
MATLTVWRFASWHEADQAIGTLEALDKQGLIKLIDAAAVSWEPDAKKPKTRQLHHLVRPRVRGGVFWGMLFGLIFAAPVAGAAIGGAAGGLSGALRDVGIDDEFIESARDQITPGTSALFLMSSDAMTDQVKTTLDLTGIRPHLIESNLSAEQEAALREMFPS